MNKFYTYDAAGNKLKKVTVDNTVTPSKTTTTDYIGGIVYENNELQFLGHEEGRIRPVRDVNNTITGFVYDYFLKDHLGNVRMVLTDEQQIDHYPTATLEGTGTGSPLSKEEDYYDINESYVVDKPTTTNPSNLLDYINDNGTNNPHTFGNRNAVSQKMYRLNANTNRTGMSRILQVMAGDKIDILAKSYYKYGGTVTNTTFDAGDIINAFLAVTGGGNVAVQHGATSPLLNANNSGLVLPLNGFTDNNPVNANNNVKAGINYIILDAEFNFETGGFDPVSSDALGGLKSHFLQDISIPKNGYIYIYCSNESNIDVCFDNLEVVHTRGPILEETHYYPFGLTMAGISSKAYGGVENKRKFVSQELDDDFSLNWYQFKFRNDDPQIGRFCQVDPLASEFVHNSTYAYAENKPINGIDLEGLEYYYTADGVLLGKGLNKPDNNSVRLATNYAYNKKTGKYGVNSSSQIYDNHEEFLAFASLIDAESSGNKEESYAIGNVTMNFIDEGGSARLKTLEDVSMYDNTFAQGATQKHFTAFAKLSPDKRNSKFAVGAAINALGYSDGLKGFSDYSGGADSWDGLDLISSRWTNSHRRYTWSTDSKKLLSAYKTKFNGGVDVLKFTYKSTGYQISAMKIIGKTLYTNLATGRGERKQSDIRFTY